MTLTDEQIRKLIEEGGSVTGDDGGEIALPKDPENEQMKVMMAMMGQMLASVDRAHAALAEHQSRLPAPPAAPSAAPQAKSPGCWNCNVTKRDRDGRIESFQMREWQNP